MVAADHPVAVAPADRQRIGPVNAAVLHRHDFTGATAVQHDGSAEQSARQQTLADLVACCGHIPTVERVVGSHRSSTSLSDRERETQIMMVSFAGLLGVVQHGVAVVAARPRGRRIRRCRRRLPCTSPSTSTPASSQTCVDRFVLWHSQSHAAIAGIPLRMTAGHPATAPRAPWPRSVPRAGCPPGQ